MANIWGRHNKINIQNQENTRPNAKRVKYNKAGCYLVIKLLTRTEYKDDNAIVTAQKLKFLKFVQNTKVLVEKIYFLYWDCSIDLTFNNMLTRYHPFFVYLCTLCTLVMLYISNYWTKLTCQKICPNKASEANVILVK